MIEVFIVHDGEPLGHIEIDRVDTHVEMTLAGDDSLQYGEYTVRFGIDRGSAVGVSSRTLYAFPRKQYNVFALVLQALNTLAPKDLELERDYDIDSVQASVPQALARRLRGKVREISGGFSRLHHH